MAGLEIRRFYSDARKYFQGITSKKMLGSKNVCDLWCESGFYQIEEEGAEISVLKT